MNLSEAWKQHINSAHRHTYYPDRRLMEFDTFRAGWVAAGGQSEFLEESLMYLALSMRATNCLLAAEVMTIGELLQRTSSSLFEITNLGRGTLKEIEAALALHGLSLAGDKK